MNKTNITKATIVNILINIKAIKFSSKNKYFLWASGIKSPIYIDNRLLFSHPAEYNMIINSFVQKIKSNYSCVTKIIGVATSGISFATTIANFLNLPFGYIRKQTKNHGTNKLVEGVELTDTDFVLIIEDVLSTGTSSLSAASIIKKISPKTTILAICSVFSYETTACKMNFLKANVKRDFLVSAIDLIDILGKNSYYSQHNFLEVKQFLTNL